ncbi:hypothetical protein HPP92_018906 [Vanilla planifolia]|uniref:Uncharacterized protein n=1 Tax=Vanilla planifolia TaxID=51239 RepID=A0A835QAR9_VANPL|nr:hypothetical protein HPP92_018906 [Vanilla planifolia]
MADDEQQRQTEGRAVSISLIEKEEMGQRISLVSEASFFPNDGGNLALCSTSSASKLPPSLPHRTSRVLGLAGDPPTNLLLSDLGRHTQYRAAARQSPWGARSSRSGTPMHCSSGSRSQAFRSRRWISDESRWASALLRSRISGRKSCF